MSCRNHLTRMNISLAIEGTHIYTHRTMTGIGIGIAYNTAHTFVICSFTYWCMRSCISRQSADREKRHRNEMKFVRWLAKDIWRKRCVCLNTGKNGIAKWVSRIKFWCEISFAAFAFLFFHHTYITSCYCCSFVKRDKSIHTLCSLKTRSNSIFRIFNAVSKAYILHVNVPTHISEHQPGRATGRNGVATATPAKKKKYIKKEIKKSIFMMRWILFCSTVWTRRA